MNMKRITKIFIENYKAYLSRHVIDLPNGCNLLVYGENGSGKSSFVKAVMHYLSSSVKKDLSYQHNYYMLDKPGTIQISFADYDEVSHTIVPETEVLYKSSSDKENSDNDIDFIKDAAVTTGSLDYLSLLQVFLVGDNKDKFFDFVVVNLLGDFISVFTGATNTFYKRWSQLQDILLVKSKTRNMKIHKKGLADLLIFESDLRSTLEKVFADVNSMLRTYFPHFGLEVQFELAHMTVTYGKGRANWHINKGFTLKVTKDGTAIDNYKMVLNEARLSAISICLYLASNKLIPKNELKLLLLDDIFIGIDSSNRLPFLRLLSDYFASYQIILLTYDRNWYNLARTYLTGNVSQEWITKEIYNSETVVDGQAYFDPLVINGETPYEKASSYLYSRDHPDYPASANYYRKFIEKLYASYIPESYMKDDDAEQIEPYKLTQITHRLFRLLSNMPHYIVDLYNLLQAVNFIRTMLSPLIHPLSHYSDNEVYRSELIELDHHVILLADELKKADMKSNSRILLEKGMFVKFTYIGDSSWNFEYIYKLKENILIYKNGAGTSSISLGDLTIYQMEGTDGTGKKYNKRINKGSNLFSLLKGHSLEERANGLFSYIDTNYSNAHFVFNAADFIDCITVYDEQNNIWIKLSDKINQIHIL